MGKIRSKSGEGLSGLVGNLVFFSYKGQTYIRTRPRKRAKNSWSERQLLAQQRFAALKAFWRRFSHSPVQEIWWMADKNIRGDNLFLRTNKSAFAPDGSLTDPERLHLTAGALPLPGKMTAARSQGDPDKVEVTWLYDPGSAMVWDDDELMMMVSYDGNFRGPIATGALRKQESAVIILPTIPGTIDAIWLFFASEGRNIYSQDQYFKI